MFAALTVGRAIKIMRPDRLGDSSALSIATGSLRSARSLTFTCHRTGPTTSLMHSDCITGTEIALASNSVPESHTAAEAGSRQVGPRFQRGM
jgi:hypothetical protein